MKYWLSHLPLEVWVDVFCYRGISRRKLGQIVDRIGNQKFAEYLQFYLHDWGKRILNELYFDKAGLYTFTDYRAIPLYLDFPQTPMPEKITSFEYIQIRHFDAQTLEFLRQIRPVLTDVELKLIGISSDNLFHLRVILANLVPLLGGIHSLSYTEFPLETVQQWLGEKMAALSVLRFITNDVGYEQMHQANLNFLMSWLTSSEEQEDNNNGPKLFEVIESSRRRGRAFSRQIGMAVREQFLAAKRPSKFAIIFHRMGWGFGEFHLRNSIGEQLHGERIGHPWNHRIQITRHPANCGPELQEWVEENMDKSGLLPNIDETIRVKKRGQIDIRYPTIGNEFMHSMKRGIQQQDDQQPSTSKKARIA